MPAYRSRIPAFLAGLLFLGMLPALAQPVARQVLPNGLEVLVKESHAAPVFAFYIWYHVGARNEVGTETGLSHFLEHMTFKGTKTLGPAELDRLVTARGGAANGMTWLDFTAYTETLPKGDLELPFRLEADRMSNCLISEKDVTSERGVVLSEMEGDENSPAFLLGIAVNAAAFQAHPYHHPTIGWKWDLRHWTQKQVADYYHNHYVPNDATVVVVGDVEANEVFRMAQKYFGDIPRGPEMNQVVTEEPKQEGERRVILRRPGTTAYLQIVYHVPAINHPDHVPLEVLQSLLSSGRTSRIYKALVDKQLATSAAGYDYENRDPTLFEFDATLRPGVTHKQVEDAIYAVIKDLLAGPISDQELQKAKNQTKAGFVYSADSVSRLAYQIGFYDTIYDYTYVEKFPSLVDAVTKDDLTRVARTYFTEDNRTVGWFIPSTFAPEAPQRRGPQMYRDQSAQARVVQAPPPGEQFHRLPQAKKVVLKNGMTVILQENHSAPLVSIYGNVLAGPVLDPQAKPGLASFTAGMLSRGTRTRTWQQIAESLDFVAAGIGFDVGSQVGVVSGRCLKPDVTLTLDLLADQIQNPSFPEAEIEKVRQQIQAAIKEEDDDTEAVANREFYATLFPPSHPLNHRASGTTESVASITRQDLIDFHRRCYRPDTTMLAVVGDFSASELLPQIEAAFGKWKRPSAPVPKLVLPPVPAPAKDEQKVVTMRNKSQTNVVMGFPGISRSDPRFYSADLLNYILGGGFVSRMTERIRQEGGMAYYAYSYFQALKGPGPWVLEMGVNPANVDKAVAMAKGEIARLVTSPPTEDEIQLWKNYVNGTVARRMETFSGVARELVNAEFYNLGLDFPYRYPTILRAITKEQLAQAAKELMHPEHMLTVIAGPYPPE